MNHDDPDDVDADLLSAWNFVLPDQSIARRPLPQRQASRLLHLDNHGGLHHRAFVDVVDLLKAGDVLVVNDTTVLPARLRGEKAQSGGKVEVLLVRPVRSSSRQWIVLVHASKKPKVGSRLVFPAGTGSVDALLATVNGPVLDEPGAWTLDFQGDVLAFARCYGEVPLPPYLNRAPDDDDDQRYQTVFRDVAKEGSSAAPTAGLHFDEQILGMLAARGVGLATVTLHVGPGTFLPVHSERLSTHVMHPEPWWLSSTTAAQLNEARLQGKRIIAVGTTAARVLESSRADLEADAPFCAGEGLTRLFIRPPRRVRGFDALLTNFHLPQSTLLVLVGTLVGRRRLLRAYAEAVQQGYRFYSYGDCCFIECP